MSGDWIESTASISGKTNGMTQKLLFLLVSAVLLFWGLGTRSLWAAEGRWAEIVREMLLTGDFFHPTIGGEPYFDKPLLTYWFRVIFCASIFGFESDRQRVSANPFQGSFNATSFGRGCLR